MERQKNKKLIGLIILIMLHLVGLVGFHIEATKTLFQSLVPANLIISFLVLASAHQGNRKDFWIFSIIIFLSGYLIEVIGVQSQILFGPYAYDTSLGPKIMGVPPTMGINWWTLIYCSGISLQQLRLPSYGVILLGAFIMVCLDLFIEPVAIEHLFWHWMEYPIPFKNYIAWFCLSIPLLWIFTIQKKPFNNPLAIPMLLIQFIFFGSFYLIRLLDL